MYVGVVAWVCVGACVYMTLCVYVCVRTCAWLHLCALEQVILQSSVGQESFPSQGPDVKLMRKLLLESIFS